MSYFFEPSAAVAHFTQLIYQHFCQISHFLERARPEKVGHCARCRALRLEALVVLDGCRTHAAASDGMDGENGESARGKGERRANDADSTHAE